MPTLVYAAQNLEFDSYKYIVTNYIATGSNNSGLSRTVLHARLSTLSEPEINTLLAAIADELPQNNWAEIAPVLEIVPRAFIVAGVAGLAVGAGTYKLSRNVYSATIYGLAGGMFTLFSQLQYKGQHVLKDFSERRRRAEEFTTPALLGTTLRY